MSNFRAFFGAELYCDLSWFSVYSMIGSHMTKAFASEVRMMDSVLQDNLEKLQAYTYVWDDKNDPDLYGEWDFEVIFFFLFSFNLSSLLDIVR